VPMTDRFADSWTRNAHVDVVLVTKIEHCSNKVTAPLQQQRGNMIRPACR
jgi:hypothetical protein